MPLAKNAILGIVKKRSRTAHQRLTFIIAVSSGALIGFLITLTLLTNVTIGRNEQMIAIANAEYKIAMDKLARRKALEAAAKDGDY